MQKKIFIYPIQSNKNKLNPYIISFYAHLKEKNTICNEGGKNRGIFELVKYLNCDLFVFNWTENLPSLPYGILQSLTYILFTSLIKLNKKKKICWVLHNKKPHKANSKLCNYLMTHNSKVSNLIITHAKDGVDFYKKKYNRSNIFYYPHPKYDNVPTYNIKAEKLLYDFILWGTIEPYKNIVEFLQTAKKNTYYHNKKIMICGKCWNPEYKKHIESLLTPNITFIERYIDEQELELFIYSSRTILFCYAEDSVLSSGALTYSLAFQKQIIGPNLGSFKDYMEKGLISTFNSITEIPTIVDNFHISEDLISEYLNTYNWENFIMKLDELAFH